MCLREYLIILRLLFFCAFMYFFIAFFCRLSALRICGFSLTRPYADGPARQVAKPKNSNGTSDRNPGSRTGATQ